MSSDAGGLEPESGLVRLLARCVLAGGVSERLDAYRLTHGQGGLDAFIERSYWELGFGCLAVPGGAPRVMVVGLTPSENHLWAEASQPWGVLPLVERIARWRRCDAWTLGGTDPAAFERDNAGLAFEGPGTWAYFQRLRALFRAAGAETLLQGSYCTNASKFTSAKVPPAFAAEAAACRPVLVRQLALVRPRVVVAVGRADVVPELIASFAEIGGTLAVRQEAVFRADDDARRQPRYYASGLGRLPGLDEPVLVVGIPHTSGKAHINFDPYLPALAARLREDLAGILGSHKTP